MSSLLVKIRVKVESLVTDPLFIEKSFLMAPIIILGGVSL